MEKPLISVVVPIYNSEKYLPQCVESILNQTYTNLELILVDDGSTDGSGQICDTYAVSDDRVRVVHKQNGGVSSARNIGLEICKGTYIAFVDSDDEIEPLFFADSVENICRSGTELYICGLVMETWSNGKLIDAVRCGGKKKVYTIRDLIEAKGTDYPSICISGPCCKLYKADLVRKYQLYFDDTMTLGEDTCFVYDYLAHIQTAVFSDQYYYHYHRGNAESLYSRYNEDFFGQYKRTIEKEVHVARLHRCSDACIAGVQKGGAVLLIDSLMKEYKFYNQSSDVKRKQVFHRVAEHPLISVCNVSDFSTLPRRILFLAVKYKMYYSADLLLRVGRLVGKIG